MDDQSTATLRVRLLGGFRVERDGQPVPDGAWQRRPARTLVKLLATCPGHRLHREQVEDLLWPDAEPGTAAAPLRKALHYARHALEPDLAPRQASATLRLADDMLSLEAVDVDADGFESAATAALAAGSLDALRDAADRYDGELLPEDRYADWAAARRETLARLHHDLLLAMATIHERRGERQPAAELLRRLLRDDPAREDIHRRLMTLAATSGNRHDALLQYQQCRATLRDELETEPAPETERLYHDILSGNVATVPSARTPLPTVARRQVERPLAGRGDVLARLTGALNRAEHGEGAAILVLGELGIGKSRLLAEIALTAHRRDMVVLWGTAWEQEDRLPYGPIAEALGAFIATQPAETRQRLAGRHPELATLVPALGLGPPPAPVPGDQRPRLFAAVTRLLATLATSQPLVLVLEDLHVADSSTLQLLHHLARSAPSHRWLIAATLRDDLDMSSEAQRLATGTGADDPFARITLTRLLPEDGGALLAGLLGDDGPIAPELRAAIADRAMGNPFVATETMRALIDRGAVSRSDRGWTLADPASLPVPRQLRALVEERIGRIGDDAGRVLTLVATAGSGCTFSLLRDASDLDEPALLDALDTAIAARVLEERDDGYAFAHPIYRPALVERLTRPRRASLHAALARALVATPPTDPAAIEALAHHWISAGEPPRALPWLIEAADHAASVYANTDAIHRLQRARDILDAPTTPAEIVRRHRAGVLRRLAELYALTGNSLLAHDACLTALAMPSLPPLLVATLHRLAATQSLAMNDIHDAEQHIARATPLLIGSSPETKRERLRLILVTAQSHFLAERFTEALGAAETGVELATQVGSKPDQAQALEIASMACLPLGRWNEGMRYEHRHAGLVDVNRFVRDIADVHFCFAEYHTYARRDADTARVFERAIGEATKVDAPRSLALCHYYLGVTAYFHGRFAEALTREDDAITHYRRAGSTIGEAIARQIRGVSLTALGRLDDGRDELERGLALADDGALRSHARVRLYAALCRNRIDANDAEGARRYADAGLALTEEPSTCICYASFLPGATVAYAITGDLERAAAMGARAMEAGRAFESPAFICMAQQANGVVHALAREWEPALEALGEARTLAETYGLPYEIARTLLVRAFVHIQRRERGDLPAATGLMTEASARLLRLGVRTSVAQISSSMGFLRAHATR